MNATFLKTVSIEHLTRQQKKTPTAISLFTGCGGAALGLRQAGYEIRVMVEWSKEACNTLRVNWTYDGRRRSLEEDLMKQIRMTKRQQAAWLRPHWYQEREPAIMQVDIMKTPTADILKAADLEVGDASLLEGGFPCQGYSTANNKRAIDDPRNQLYKECVRIIGEALPRVFMLENVPGIVSMADGEVIRQVCEDLAGVGYSVSWNILNAADYGVPQNRKRVFLIGLRQDAAIFRKNGRIAFHMGCAPGAMTFPKWYFDRYAKKNKNVAQFRDAEGAEPSTSPQGPMVTIPAGVPSKP